MNPSSLSVDFTERLMLDNTKIAWHKDRIDKWQKGERFAPITIDMALTRTCNYACRFCYAVFQENQRHPITKEVITRFLDDCADLGVRGISLVSDGESTLNTSFVHAIQHGASKGISMAVGSNCYLLDEKKLRAILPHLTYMRCNITAGEPKRYEEIMGVKAGYFEKVVENLKLAMKIKKELGLKVTIGMQMVLMPEFADQIIPLAKLGKEIMPDYLVIKHTSDTDDGSIGVDYGGYAKLYPLLQEAEAMSCDGYQVHIKWSKIGDKGTRNYERCYGPPFIIQLSGSGLVAPCGMLFGEEYKKFHIGNICDVGEKGSFKKMVEGDKYWEVMSYLSGPNFNAKKMCGSLCLQHKTNQVLNDIKNNGAGLEDIAGRREPAHVNFI